jgi:hypothetical protein
MRYIITYEEIKTLNYILSVNENNQINEGLIDRIKEVAEKGKLTKNVVMNLIKKGLISATLLTSLLSTNPTFASVYNSLPKSDKLEQIDNLSTEGIFDVSKSFKSGVWKLDEQGKADLKVELLKLVDHINSLQNPKFIKFKIIIDASESRLRNRDAETKEVLPDGELAKRRATETKTYMDAFFNDYNVPNIIIEVNHEVNGPKYTGQDKKIFNEYQYVKLKVNPIEVNTNTYNSNNDNFCSFKDSISVASIKNNIGLQRDFNVSGEYGSGNIILTPGSIPDRVVVYGDGKLIGDSGFFSTGVNPYLMDTWDYAPANILALTKLHRAGSNATKTNLEIHTVNNFEELMDLMLKKKSLINKYKGFTSDRNEDDVAKPMRELIAMYKAGVRDFVFYKKGQVKVKFDLAGKYNKIEIIVYSPRDKSDFEIKVNCSSQFTKKIP